MPSSPELVRMGLLKKKPDWTDTDFRTYWLQHHGALAAKLPGLRHYQQNHVVDSAQRGITYARGPESLDGISELWFDSDEAMRAAIATAAGEALVADENHFIGQLRVIACEQHEVIAPPAAGSGALKRMSLLRRRADVSEERFAREWHVRHAELLRAMPEVRGYRQNRVVQRQVPKGVSVGYDALPIDGIVELWFDDKAAIDAAFSSPAGKAAMAHAAEFIGEITTFLVEPHVIV